jgi:hypothetical protein
VLPARRERRRAVPARRELVTISLPPGPEPVPPAARERRLTRADLTVVTGHGKPVGALVPVSGQLPVLSPPVALPEPASVIELPPEPARLGEGPGEGSGMPLPPSKTKVVEVLDLDQPEAEGAPVEDRILAVTTVGDRRIRLG